MGAVEFPFVFSPRSIEISSWVSLPWRYGQNHPEYTCRVRTDGGNYADCKPRRNARDEGRSRSWR